MKDIAINLDKISKKYIIHHEKPTLVESFFRRKETFLALDGINLTIKKGEKIGIIGNNGAGKSTLLKIISGITTPTEGQVKTKGKIASLIELNAGFHPDLTGEENIYLNGLLLGMTRSEIKRKFESIVSFSELNHFIDAPFYTYSRGMMLRLGFSVAIHTEPDILIIDEVLATGDKSFQEKSHQKIRELLKEKTFLFVSHDLEAIRATCEESILIDRGKIKKKGKTSEIIEYYKKQIKSLKRVESVVKA